MNAKEILARKFEKGFNGYKSDDVDEFLKELSNEFSSLQRENSDLEKKLEVLADKIREYRNDEDALKEALLGAQKQGQLAISEAKEKARKIIEDAETEAERIKNESLENNEKLKKEGEKIEKNSHAEAERIISDANNKARRITDEMNIQIEISREILTRTKNEVEDYRTKIISEYHEHIKRLETFPSECENDFISKTYIESQNNKPNQVKASNVNSDESINGPIDAEEAVELDIAKIYEEIENETTVPTDTFELEFDAEEITPEINELTFNPMFEEDDEGSDDIEEFEDKSSKKSNINNENIFFRKGSSNSKNENKEKLEFGNNKQNKKK